MISLEQYEERNLGMGYNNLQLAMRQYCPCCSRGEEAAIEYVREHDNNPVALYNEAIELGDCMGGDFISIIVSSAYNIFVPWFKAVLVHFKEKGETGVNIQAEDILDYYKENFEKEDELNGLQ